MSIIEQIHDIARKLGLTVKGETISELMMSLNNEVDKKFVNDTKAYTPTFVSDPKKYEKREGNRNLTAFSSKKRKRDKEFTDGNNE